MLRYSFGFTISFIPLSFLIDQLDIRFDASFVYENLHHYIGDVSSTNKCQGKGALYRPTGVRVKGGQWANDKQHGKECYQLTPSGNEYNGAMVNDQFDGLGYLTYASTDVVYCGQFVANRISGFGIKWNGDGARVECGKFEDDGLVRSCAVPTAMMPIGCDQLTTKGKG